MIPDDPLPPYRPSGIRLGTPALTTRGMGEAEMELIGTLIFRALKNNQDKKELQEVQNQVRTLADRFPLYPELV